MKEILLEELMAVIKPFIDAGIYKNEEDALESILEDLVETKIKRYKEDIKQFEKKHGTFDKFSAELKIKPSTEKEDEWMEWEAAINMLDAWTKVKNKLTYAS